MSSIFRKSHYEFIALTLWRMKQNVTDSAYEAAVLTFAYMLGEENLYFSKEAFYKACDYVPVEPVKEIVEDITDIALARGGGGKV